MLTTGVASSKVLGGPLQPHPDRPGAACSAGCSSLHLSRSDCQGETAIKRRTFDVLVATGGLFLAVTLIVSGGLLTWAHNFIGNEVHTQLAAQQIFFPPAGSPAIKAPEFAAMRQYAGQQMTTGAQAEV
jgi:hypothetical protein